MASIRSILSLISGSGSQLAQPVLTLHIGLPKTATTFLQKEVFQSSPKLTYVYNVRRGPLEKLLERQQRVSTLRFPTMRKELEELLPSGNVLVSDENISMHVKEPWRNKGPTPATFCKRAEQLQGVVGTLRVIVGIRRQDQWFASRYAESARLCEDFSQADFDERAERLVKGPIKGSLKWLDYEKVYSQLSKCLGQENVLLLPMELVGTDPESAIRSLQDFTGAKGWARRHRIRLKQGKIQPANVLSVGGDSWSLKGHDTVLRLGEEPKAAILARYREGNRNVSEQLKLGLERFGYF